MHQLLEECYKCFSIGPHNCLQKYNAPREWVCETCGGLKNPFIRLRFILPLIYCIWCKNINFETEAHIALCQHKPVRTYTEWIRYQCFCEEIEKEGKWILR